MKKLLTIIIPIRMSLLLYQAEKRLSRLLASVPFEITDVLIVDYGTAKENQHQLDCISQFPEVILHQVEMAESIPFSIGHARDIGVQYAQTPVVMFQDIDFLCNTEMYERIYSEIIAREISSKKGKDFFCVPVAFLKEKTSQTYIEQFSNKKEYNFIVQQQLLTEGNNQYDFLVYGSSAIVVNRYNYLSLGGHSRKFSGHGAEDYDVLHRLSSRNKKAERPVDYYVDTKNNRISIYKGFRAYFSLYGIDVFNKGIFMVHLWHPSRGIPNYSQSTKNFKLLKKVMLTYDKKRSTFLPLQDKTINKKTLILSSPKSAFVKAIRDALPLMGEVFFHDEKEFSSFGKLTVFIKKNKITTVGFKNPYGNTHRLELYKSIKKSDVEYWVEDRGALPDSWFFDANGFNADSCSYDRLKWDKPLSIKEEVFVCQYIEELKYGEESLESNGKRVPLDKLRDQLSINGRKVLLVPFQRPSDSVCQYFSGELGSADNFNKFIEAIVGRVDSNEWIVLGKKHPLEEFSPDVTGVEFVPHDIHIHDLLELSDVVCLLNSGVGVLAALFEKPVIYVGDAFYGHEGINYYAQNSEVALSLLKSDLIVDKGVMHRFIHHLLDTVYSFGETHYREIIRKEDGGRLNLAESIEFREIRGLTDDVVELGNTIEPVSFNAPLFASFQKESFGVKEEKNRFGVMVKKLSFSIFIVISSIFLNENKIGKLKRDPCLFFYDAKRKLSGIFNQ